MDGLPDLPPPADHPLPTTDDQQPAAMPQPLPPPPPPGFQPPQPQPSFEQPSFEQTQPQPLPGPLPQAGPPAWSSATPGTTVVLPRPRRRRRWWLVPLAIVVLGGLAAATVLLWPKHHKETGYSLTAAATDAARHSQVTFTQAVGVVGHEIVAEAELDDTAQLAHVTVDLSSDGMFEAIIDRKADVAYFKSDFFNDIGYDIETDWVKATADYLKDQTGSGFDPFSGSSVENPLAIGALISHAKSVEDLGFVTFDGEQQKRFRVTLAADKVAKVAPQIEQQAAANDADLPDELVYDIYVSKDSTIQRTVVAVDLGTTKVTIDSSISAVDKKLKVKVPAKDDTSDAADVLG